MTERSEDMERLSDVLGGSWQGFVEQWCGGHPPGYEPSDALAALRAVSELWPESISDRRGLHPACGLIELGRSLAAVRGCDGFDLLIPRLKQQNQGAHAELIVASSLTRAGLNVRLGVPCNNHVLDLSIQDAAGSVFVEVTAPHESEILEIQRKLMLELSLRLGGSTESHSVIIEFKEDPTRELIEAVVAQLPNDASGEWREVESARFRRWQSPADERQLGVEWPGIDYRTERVVRDKSKQLARDEPNILVIDMGFNGGSVAEWSDASRRLFQPSKNRRIGAIVLYVSIFSAHLDRGFRLWRIVKNTYATHPIPEYIIRAFQALDETDALRRARSLGD